MWSSYGRQVSWELSPGVRWLRVDDGATIFAPNAAQFVDLDETGAYLLDLLDSVQWDPTEAIEALVASNDVPLDAAGQTVRTFISDLEQHGVILRIH